MQNLELGRQLSVKCLSFNNEDLSPISRIQVKIPSMVAQDCNPSTGEGEADPWGLLSSQPVSPVGETGH